MEHVLKSSKVQGPVCVNGEEIRNINITPLGWVDVNFMTVTMMQSLSLYSSSAACLSNTTFPFLLIAQGTY